MSWLFVCAHGWERVALGVPLSLTKGPLCLSYLLLFTSNVVALEAADYPFFVPGVLVLGFQEDLLYGGVVFEVSLYAILTTCVF